MIVDILHFLQKYLPIEAFIPLFFLLVILFIKYVYTPWDNKIDSIHTDIKTANSELLAVKKDFLNEIQTIKNMLSTINASIDLHKNHCEKNCDSNKLDLRKIMEKLDMIERNVTDIVSRLEKVKDDAKDGKIDLNQQLFSIKQEISDLKSKIEPLLFISRGIK